jgi:hypothetical protein
MDPSNPFGAAMQGYQFGAGIRDDQLKQQQLALAQAQQQQLQQDILAVRQSSNPSQGIADLALKYPQLSEQFKRSYDMMSTEQQQNRLSYGTQVYAAIQNNQPQLAVQMMRQRAEQMKASGANNEAQGAASFADLIEKSPEAAKVTAGLMLSGMMGPEKFATTFAQLGQEQRAQAEAPADLAKKNAEAGIKGVEAAAAPQKTALDLENTRSQIDDRAAQREIARLDTQIKQANSETQRGELILQRDKLTAELGQKQKDRAQASQDQYDTLQQSISTVDSLMKHPGLEGWFGAGTISGKQAAIIPGTDAKDFRAQLETLKSQAFMAEIKKMQGLGALSNAEGEKIASALANLDADQSQKQIKNALGVVRGVMQRAQEKLVGSGTLSTEGGGFVMKTPGYGVVKDGDINRLLQKYPGATREQVIEFLKQSGGK